MIKRKGLLKMAIEDGIRCTYSTGLTEEQQERKKMNDFFLSIWKKKPHKSEISGTWLGNEIKTLYFHHILEKRNYEMAKYDEDNIILLTWEEHQQVESNAYRYEEINRRRELLKIKYNII